MSFEAMSWAIRQKTKSAGSKLVLLLLANHANGYSGQCNPSHKLLADECEMSVSALKVHIKCLESQELLSIHRLSRDGVSLPNQYALHLSKVGQILTEGVRICPNVGQNLTEGGSESDGRVGQNLATKQEVKPVIEPVIETETTKKPRKQAEPFVLPDWIPVETWEAFLETRKKKKAANTDFAFNLVIKTLEKFRDAGHDPIEALETSIKGGWSDVYEPKPRAKEGNRNKQTKNGVSHAQNAEEPI